MKYEYSDIAITPDGDLSMSNGDLMLFGKIDGFRQAVEFRLRTQLGDMFIHPYLGNSIEDIVGKRNTEEVAEEGKNAIINALTYGNMIDMQDIKIVAIPVTQSAIVFHVEIETDTYVPYKFDMMCDLENGIRRL